MGPLRKKKLFKYVLKVLLLFKNKNYFTPAPAPGFFSSGSSSGVKEPKTPGSDRLRLLLILRLPSPGIYDTICASKRVRNTPDQLLLNLNTIYLSLFTQTAKPKFLTLFEAHIVCSWSGAICGGGVAPTLEDGKRWNILFLDLWWPRNPPPSSSLLAILAHSLFSRFCIIIYVYENMFRRQHLSPVLLIQCVPQKGFESANCDTTYIYTIYPFLCSVHNSWSKPFLRQYTYCRKEWITIPKKYEINTN